MSQSGWATRSGRSRPGTQRAVAQAIALAILWTAGAVAADAALAAPARTDRDAGGASGPGEADERAAEVARSLVDAMGGAAAWERVRTLCFDFVVEQKESPLTRRRHWWDKQNGRCRVEWTDSHGRGITAVVNLADRKGKSCTGGVPDAGKDLKRHVEDAYGLWVNDSYWLVMPFKLRDPGTHLRYARLARDAAAGDHDVLELWFDPGVGLTSKDRYWVFVNRRTHLVDRWEFLLQGSEPPPVGATWEGWLPIGPLRLPMLRCFEEKLVNLRFENVAVGVDLEEALLTDPCARP